MSRKPEKKVYYISAIPRGNVRHISSAERLDVYTGQLALDWAQIMREDLEMYMQYYRRNNSPAMTALLPSMAEKVLSSYIRYYIASLNHGRAIAAAPRRFGEESQAVTLEEIPAFFGLTTSEEIVPVRKNFTDQELQRINAIVRDNPELAARLGLTESGSNKGPNVDIAKARAAIAAAPDAVYFQEGYLPLGNVPGMGSAAAAAALPAPGMGSAGRPALPPPGLSGLLNMGSGASSAAMGSASGSASASGRNRALSLLGEGSGAAAAAAAPAPAAAAPAPAAAAPAPAAAAARAAANNGRGAAAGKSRGRATGGPAGKRGRFGSLASVPENAAAEAAEEAGAGAGAAAAAPAPGPSGGRRRRHRKTHRKSHRKTRKSHRRRTHHRRR